jgi:hypothetical protein
MSGRANEPGHAAAPKPFDIIGLGWLYALHARSSIARQRLWQAEYMISGIRDHTLALAFIRHGLPAAHGRGIDHYRAVSQRNSKALWFENSMSSIFPPATVCQSVASGD